MHTVRFASQSGSSFRGEVKIQIYSTDSTAFVSYAVLREWLSNHGFDTTNYYPLTGTLSIDGVKYLPVGISINGTNVRIHKDNLETSGNAEASWNTITGYNFIDRVTEIT